jgi:putative flippase GtrA
MGNKFIKYLLVGVVNTVFGYSMFALLIYFNLHYLFASIFATIAGVLFNFKTIGRIVFKSNNNSLIIKFIAVYLITFMLNLGGLKIFNSYHINMYLAGFLLLILCTPISYILNNKFVFKKQ